MKYPLIWPVLFSLVLHGVFAAFWHPKNRITLRPAPIVNVELKPAFVPSGSPGPAESGTLAVAGKNIEANRPGEPAVTRRHNNPQQKPSVPVLTRPEAIAESTARPTTSVQRSRTVTDAVEHMPGKQPDKTDSGGGSTTTSVGKAGNGNVEGSGSGKSGMGEPGQGTGGSGGDGPPSARYKPKPKYPRDSREMEEIGVVRLMVRVGRNGEPLSIRVIKSSGFPRLDKAAQRGVEEWRFNPARKNGETVEDSLPVTVRFNLNDP